MTRRWARVLRSQLVAVFATFAAAFSHGVADGSHPPVFAVALALAFSGLASVVFMGIRISRAGLGASIVVSQFLYHGLFTVFGSAAGGTATGAVSQAHHHGAIIFAPVAGDTVAGDAAAGASAFAAAEAGMLLAHLAAAALTFVVVLHADRAIAAIADFAFLVIAALAWLHASAPLPVRVRVSPPTRARVAVSHQEQVLRSFLHHRGPPAASRFA